MTNWSSRGYDSPVTEKQDATNYRLDNISRQLDETNRLLTRLLAIEEIRAAKTGDLPPPPSKSTIRLPGKGAI